MQRKIVIGSVLVLSFAVLSVLLLSNIGERGDDGPSQSETSQASSSADVAPQSGAIGEGGADGSVGDFFRTIHGRVIDETDRPIAGAEVRLTAYGRDAVTVVTTNEGGFEAEVIETLPILATASAESYLGGSIQIVSFEQEVDIVLRRGRQVSGVVVSGTEPVVGASVVAGAARTTTGSGGVFVFDDLPPRPVAIEARLGMARSEPSRLDLSGGPVHGLVLRLLESGSLEVRVRTGLEVPVPNARVRISPMGWDEVFELSTGDDGNVIFESMPTGTVRIAASADGLAAAEKNTDVPSEGRMVEWVSLPAAHGLVVDTRLDRGTPARGETVTLRLVRAGDGDVSDSPAQQQSAGIGEPAVFESVAAGSWRVVAHHPTYSAKPVPVEVPGPDVMVVLETGAAVSGRVIDETGAPISGAFVLATPALTSSDGRTELRPARRGRSDAAGEFSIEGLTGEGWSLVPRMSGYHFGDPLAVSPGDDGVLLRMEKAREIAGQVVDGRGAPLPQARVVARATYGDRRRVANTASDADGEFTLENLSSGSYEVHARHGQRSSDSQVIHGGRERVRLVIPIGATLRGRVVGPTGTPPERFSVLGIHFSEPSGVFRIEDLDPRETSVWVEAPGLLRKAVQVTLYDDRVTDLGMVTLDAPAAVDGSVVDAEGRGVEGATVVLDVREGEDTHPAITATDSQGGFSFTGLRLGSARIHVLAEGERSASVETRLGSGETSRVRLVVP